MDKKVFGKRLKEVCLLRNVSIAELSNAVGYNKATLHRYVNGEFQSIKFTTIKAIADFLCTSTD